MRADGQWRIQRYGIEALQLEKRGRGSGVGKPAVGKVRSGEDPEVKGGNLQSFQYGGIQGKNDIHGEPLRICSG